jgi:hypothetical protein
MFKLPLTSIIPLFGIYYGSATADNVIINDKYIEFQYTPMKFNLVPERAYDKLKEIDSDFEEPAEGELDRALQILIDENAPNAFFTNLATMDTMYSLRKMF